MKILITGSTGLLGQALCTHLARLGKVTGLSRHAPVRLAGGRHVVCDLVDANQTCDAIRRIRPEVVIHTQALSDVDRCEREPAAAHAQNVQTTANLVQALADVEPLLVQMSTDYVFDGTKGAPYDETDPPHPINVYGRSKLEAERLALGYPRSVVVRTSTLFGAGRMNFCDHIIAQVRANKLVEAFVDQVTSPTYTEDLAGGIADLIAALPPSRSLPQGRVFHLVNEGSCSREAFAQRVVDRLGCSRALIRSIRMADQQRPAPRPAYSGLRMGNLPGIIGRALQPWDHALHAYLRQRRLLN